MPKREAIVALAMALFAVVVVVFVLQSLQPPEAVAEGAPADAFSARRAMRHVEQLGAEARPLGTVAHQATREALRAELAALGLSPQLQQTLTLRQRGRRLEGAFVANVVARLAGTEGGSAILLMAHYDTRSTTPGAGDDLAGVAALLETVRAVQAGPGLRNDLIVLITDAEEPGLFGARAFAEEHPWMAEVGLVINFEGRGNRGVSMMFETSMGNLGLIRGMREAVAEPYASSLTGEVYRRMPNDTDFSVFLRAGKAGLNVAFIDGFHAYHTALDTPARLDPRSVQHHGDYALSLVRHFGDLDLARHAPGADTEAVYFNPWPFALIVYPVAWVLPLALVAVVLLGVVLLTARRHLTLGFGRIAKATGHWLLSMVAVIATGWLGWRALQAVAPTLLAAPYRAPYDTPWIVVALVVLSTAVALRLSALGRNRYGRSALACAGALVWTLLALLVSVLAPGASYLFLWPALASIVALAVAVRLSSPVHAALVLGIGALPALVLLAPMIHLLSIALGLAALVAIWVLVALALLAVTPALAVLGVRWRGVPAVLVLVSLLLAGLIVVRQGTGDPDRPRVDSLFYVWDASEREASWVSFDRAPSPWTAATLADATSRTPASFLRIGDAPVLAADAPSPAFDLPQVEVVLDPEATESTDARRLSLFAHSPRQAQVMAIRARAEQSIHGLWLDGTRYGFDDAGESGVDAPVWVRIFGVPPEGLALTLELAGDGPVEVGVSDLSYGLPDLEGAPSGPRPAGWIPSTSWLSDATIAYQSFVF